MHDSVWIALIAGLPAAIAALGTVYVAVRQSYDRKVVGAVHTLVNSSFSAQLQVSAAALRRIADLTGEAADKDIATLAERKFKEHEESQKRVDAGVTTAVDPRLPRA